MKKLSTQRLLNTVLLIAMITLFVTCKKEDPIPVPVALFSYSPATNLEAPVTLYFSNESKTRPAIGGKRAVGKAARRKK